MLALEIGWCLLPEYAGKTSSLTDATCMFSAYTEKSCNSLGWPKAELIVNEQNPPQS